MNTVDLADLAGISSRHRVKLTDKSNSKVSESAIVFSHIEDVELPSYSPRPPDDVDPELVKDQSDKRQLRDRQHYLSKHPGLNYF
jgi:hypothetical protein